MSSQGDDCYYFYYSSCSRGDRCTFRHCEAAVGSETVCTLWEEGRCFRRVCMFRHMNIDKKRNTIPCYWETQPSGCQKSNCAFHHTKDRYVDGKLLRAHRFRTVKNISERPEDGAKTADRSRSQAKLSTLPNAPTHLRVVIKLANETVPSSMQLGVEVNAISDDDDDGCCVDIGKRNVNQAKFKAKCRCRMACGESLEKRRKPSAGEDNVGRPSKRGLAERLGQKIRLPDRRRNEVHQLKIHKRKSIKERLGFPSDRSCEESRLTAQPLEEFHIKTLQDIKLEKLSRKQKQAPHHKLCTSPVIENANDTNKTGIHIKSLKEVLAEKKLQQIDSANIRDTECVNNKQNKEGETPYEHTVVKLKIGGYEAQQQGASEEKCVSDRVHVKTLEEIKQEKALRQQTAESIKKATPEAEAGQDPRMRLPGKTNAVKEEKVKTETSILGGVNQTCLGLHTNDPDTREVVKNFEETAREKMLRKPQEATEQLIKEQTLPGSSPVVRESANGNSHPGLATATKEAIEASALLQRQPHQSSCGQNKNLPLGKRKASSPLKSSQASPVQDQQPSPQRALKSFPPANPLAPSCLRNPQQPTSLEHPCQPSTPKKQQFSPVLARTQHPALFLQRAQQLSTLVKHQKLAAPIKPQQSSLQVQPQEPSLPVMFPQFSTQVSFPQTSSPVKAHQPSSPLKDQSFPTTALQRGMLPQQPPKIQTQQLPCVVPKDLSVTEIVQMMSNLLTEGSTIGQTGPATQEGKDKPKASIKPSIGKKAASPKGPQKRKRDKSDDAVVAAVTPLTPSNTTTILNEPPAKKAASTIVDSSAREAVQSPRTCLEMSTESVGSIDVQQMAPVPVTERSETQDYYHHQPRYTGPALLSPSPPLPAGDEFEKLMWELFEGPIEKSEIDLDAVKDED